MTGGNMSVVTRIGDTLRRNAGPWTPTVHRLLHHLRTAGLPGVPEPFGLDEQGREVMGFLAGTVPRYPMPDWLWGDDILTASAAHLRAFHRASADFDRSGGVWQLPTHQPAEVICHNDFAPYNLVFDDAHRLVGVIDWDTCSPGPRIWDLAYLAYRLVPLTATTNPDAPPSPVAERRRRLDLLLSAYGGGFTRAGLVDTVDHRVRELTAFTAARADPTQNPLAEHVVGYEADLVWLNQVRAELG